MKQIDNYVLRLNSKIDQGSIGSVCLAIDIKNENKKVAVKQISLSSINKNNEILMQFNNKIKTMRMIKNPNLVQLINCFKTPNNIYLIFEYCNGYSLQSYLNKNNNMLSETKTLHIIREIISGYRSLFKQKIIHRDLKPGNILLHNSIPKITYFSTSKILEDIMEQVDLASLKYSPKQLNIIINNQKKSIQYFNIYREFDNKLF